MKNNRTKPFKNYQKKKYYTNRNTPQKNKGEVIFYYDPLKRKWGERITK